MIGSILSMLGSGAAGGLTGLIGNALQSWARVREIKVKNEHDLAMRNVDMQEMRLEADLQLKQTDLEMAGRLSIAETEAGAAKDVAAAELQGKSYDNDKATYGIGWVDAFRGFIRPFGTLYTLFLMTAIAAMLFNMSEMTPEPAEAWALFVTIVDSIIYLTVMAFSWWFGQRPNRTAK